MVAILLDYFRLFTELVSGTYPIVDMVLAG